MIQKTLVFVVDFTGKMIDGEKPVGFLRANDKNKNTIFLITPEQPTTQIKARFLAKTKHNDGVAVNGILTTDYKVNDLVSETKSYYEKIKDWNVFYFPVPERVVNYIASNAGGEIGITFEFVEWQLPRIKDIYGDFLGEITDRRFSIDANEDGYYVNRVIDYEYNGDKYGYNDLFIVGGGTITAIRAFPRTGGAVGGYFGVDPMYDSGVFEYVDGDDIDPSITTQIKNQVNNLTSEVYFLNVDNEKNKTDIATLKTQVSDINVDIVDLDNRINDNASDIIDLGDDLVEYADLKYILADRKIIIDLYNKHNVKINTNEIVLPFSSTIYDGLLSKADYALLHGMKSGDEIVGKALKDEANRNIADTYTKHISLSYNQPSRQLNIGLFNGKNIKTNDYSINLPLATQALSGLMSTTDKTRLDNLWDILQNGDDQNFVDTIHEMLEIFKNYPEGVDIIAKFAEKADKAQVNAELATKANKNIKINDKDLSQDITLYAEDIPCATNWFSGHTTAEALNELHNEKLNIDGSASSLLSYYNYPSGIREAMSIEFVIDNGQPKLIFKSIAGLW